MPLTAVPAASISEFKWILSFAHSARMFVIRIRRSSEISSAPALARASSIMRSSISAEAEGGADSKLVVLVSDEITICFCKAFVARRVSSASEWT